MTEPNLVKDLFGNLEEIPTRNGYGDGVVEAGEENEDVVVLCCDLTGSTRSKKFKDTFPERFVEVGVAEQNMAGLGAGMALGGKIPYISSYAVFNPGRNWDQIRVSICYSQANVKIIGAHAGISVGPDGATHQALEDIAITRVLPNMIVVAPCDYHQAKKAAKAIAEVDGPCYMRFARVATPVFTTEDTPFEIGKADTYKEGSDVSIIACGPLVHEALKAAEKLEEKGISARVINSHTIKPLDEDTIINAAKETGAVVTVEEHQINGGLGSAVSELLTKKHPVPIEFVAVKDRFGESGEPRELLEKFGLTAPHIEKAVKKAYGRKHGPGYVDPFHFTDGREAWTVEELAEVIKDVDGAFEHHVTDDRNDFANWTRDVLGREELATEMEKCVNKKSILSLIEEFTT